MLKLLNVSNFHPSVSLYLVVLLRGKNITRIISSMCPLMNTPLRHHRTMSAFLNHSFRVQLRSCMLLFNRPVYTYERWTCCDGRVVSSKVQKLRVLPNVILTFPYALHRLPEHPPLPYIFVGIFTTLTLVRVSSSSKPRHRHSGNTSSFNAPFLVFSCLAGMWPIPR